MSVPFGARYRVSERVGAGKAGVRVVAETSVGVDSCLTVCWASRRPRGGQPRGVAGVGIDVVCQQTGGSVRLNANISEDVVGLVRGDWRRGGRTWDDSRVGVNCIAQRKIEGWIGSRVGNGYTVSNSLTRTYFSIHVRIRKRIHLRCANNRDQSGCRHSKRHGNGSERSRGSFLRRSFRLVDDVSVCHRSFMNRRSIKSHRHRGKLAGEEHVSEQAGDKSSEITMR